MRVSEGPEPVTDTYIPCTDAAAAAKSDTYIPWVDGTYYTYHPKYPNPGALPRTERHRLHHEHNTAGPSEYMLSASSGGEIYYRRRLSFAAHMHRA